MINIPKRQDPAPGPAIRYSGWEVRPEGIMSNTSRVLAQTLPRRADRRSHDAWTVSEGIFPSSVALVSRFVIATIVLWLMVDAMHVFSQIVARTKTN